MEIRTSIVNNIICYCSVKDLTNNVEMLVAWRLRYNDPLCCCINRKLLAESDMCSYQRRQRWTEHLQVYEKPWCCVLEERQGRSLLAWAWLCTTSGAERNLLAAENLVDSIAYESVRLKNTMAGAGRGLNCRERPRLARQAGLHHQQRTPWGVTQQPLVCFFIRLGKVLNYLSWIPISRSSASTLAFRFRRRPM